MYGYVCMAVYGYALRGMYVWICMHGYPCMAMHVWLCIYGCVCMDMYVCMAIYRYIYISTLILSTQVFHSGMDLDERKMVSMIWIIIHSFIHSFISI